MMDLVTECIEPSPSNMQGYDVGEIFQHHPRPESQNPLYFTDRGGGFHANRDTSISSTLYPKTNIKLSSRAVIIWCLCA